MTFYSLEGHDTDAAMRAAKALGEDIGRIESARYRNGELHLSVTPSPRGARCVLAAATAPPDTRLWETLLAAHTLKKEGAAHVTALIPYLGYSRHDKDRPGESMATGALGACMKAAGIDEIVTVDLHSGRDTSLMQVPVVSLSADALFAEVLTRDGWGDATVVAPDNGAVPRCERVRAAMGIAAPVAVIAKRRVDGGVVRESAVQGDVSARAVIVDDMLDTGETLRTACELLRAGGVQEIAIAVSHGVFTGTAWERLPELGVSRLYCTDSLALPDRARKEWVEILSCGQLLNDHFAGRGDS